MRESDTLGNTKSGRVKKQAPPPPAPKPNQRTMKDKHTPGPWKVDGTYIYEVEQDKIIAEVETYNNDELPYEANARLMAAAPELLEFVQYVAKGIPVWDDPDSLEESVYHLEKRAKRLVSKIEGDE